MKLSKGYVIAVHCICWLIFLSLPALFVAGLSEDFSTVFNRSAWLFFSVYIFIFYLHTNVLFTKLYFTGKYFFYLVSVLLLTVVVFYLRPFDRLVQMQKRHGEWPSHNASNNPGIPDSLHQHSLQNAGLNIQRIREWRGHGPHFDIISILLFIMIIALSITMVIVKRWRLAVDQAAKAEAAKVSSELAMLKAQINPHFLFNTLNNIYSLAVTHDEHTAASIMKLSNIMRYVTDEATEDYVSLASEANFISDYIELQRLRLGSKVSLQFTVTGSLTGKVIAPLILITFIENVFKYGLSNNEPSRITIELGTDQHSIRFYCCNRLFPSKAPVEGTRIGIANTRKRLEHLYPGKYDLKIGEEDGLYCVNLVLHFN